jgi:multicomponent Na+:H+ antiporter subunit D
MVVLGVYGMARVYWTVFVGVLGEHEPALRDVLLSTGVLTAIIGALMCFEQHHLKRLLAFSTVSHIGLLMIGVALLTPHGFAGAAIYALAHGLVKASLFLCVGVILHRRATVDELKLRGRGRNLRRLGALFGLGGLGLAGLPPFGTFLGKALIEASAAELGHSWVFVIFLLTSTLTGGAVLRAAGRIFVGWGPLEKEPPELSSEGEEHEPETVEERGRTPLVMVAPTGLLLAAGCFSGVMPGLVRGTEMAAARFQDWTGYMAAVLSGEPSVLREPAGSVDPSHGAFYGLASAASALALAATALSRHRLPRRLRRWTSSIVGPSLRRLRLLHSGHVGDYVAWLIFGVVAFGAACAAALWRP